MERSDGGGAGVRSWAVLRALDPPHDDLTVLAVDRSPVGPTIVLLHRGGRGGSVAPALAALVPDSTLLDHSSVGPLLWAAYDGGAPSELDLGGTRIPLAHRGAAAATLDAGEAVLAALRAPEPVVAVHTAGAAFGPGLRLMAAVRTPLHLHLACARGSGTTLPTAEWAPTVHGVDGELGPRQVHTVSLDGRVYVLASVPSAAPAPMVRLRWRGATRVVSI